MKKLLFLLALLSCFITQHALAQQKILGNDLYCGQNDSVWVYVRVKDDTSTAWYFYKHGDSFTNAGSDVMTTVKQTPAHALVNGDTVTYEQQQMTAYSNAGGARIVYISMSGLCLVSQKTYNQPILIHWALRGDKKRFKNLREYGRLQE